MVAEDVCPPRRSGASRDARIYDWGVVISVVMPAHNEAGYLEASVKSLVEAIRTRSRTFELIVVQNGSTDTTAHEADALAAEYEEVRVIHRPEPDYGAALRAGFLAASGNVVINFDVDLVNLDFFDRAMAVLREETVSIVVGSKRAGGSQDRRSTGRRWITSIFAATLRYGFGLTVSDTHGIKALRRADLLSIVDGCQFGRDIFDTELILRAERSGLTIKEVPVAVSDIRPPRTSIARRIPRTLLGLARLRLALWRA